MYEDWKQKILISNFMIFQHDKNNWGATKCRNLVRRLALNLWDFIFGYDTWVKPLKILQGFHDHLWQMKYKFVKQARIFWGNAGISLNRKKLQSTSRKEAVLLHEARSTRSLNSKIFLWISTIRINWSAPTNDNSSDSSSSLLLTLQDFLGAFFNPCKVNIHHERCPYNAWNSNNNFPWILNHETVHDIEKFDKIKKWGSSKIPNPRFWAWYNSV